MLCQENTKQRLYAKKNMFGEPIANDLVYNILDMKNKSLVTEDKNCVNANKINSREEIANCTKDLQSFNQLIEDREIYYNQSKNKLKEFVIFGKYWLDEFAQVCTIMDEYETRYEFPIVCTFSEFYNIQKKIRKNNEYVQISVKKIPKDGESCPWCQKRFTIEDLKKFRFGTINGKTAHLECKKQYEREKMNIGRG